MAVHKASSGVNSHYSGLLCQRCVRHMRAILIWMIWFRNKSSVIERKASICAASITWLRTRREKKDDDDRNKTKQCGRARHLMDGKFISIFVFRWIENFDFWASCSRTHSMLFNWFWKLRNSRNEMGFVRLFSDMCCESMRYTTPLPL